MPSARPPLPLIVEPEDFQQQEVSPQLILVDLCDRESYLKGHIPGAIHIEPKATTRGGTPPGLLPLEPELRAIVDQLGIQEDSHLLIYDNEGGGWAGRFIWLLDSIGVKNYSYLNGGLTAWQAISGQLQTGEQSAASNASFDFTISQAASVNRQEIEFLLGAPGSMDIWDARSPAEFSGEKIVAQRGGHIPGAINGNWLDFMDKERHLKIRSDAHSYLKSLGIDGSRPIVTHCQTHHRSGLTYLIGKALDYDIRAYPGSWSEWGNLPDTEIE